MDVPANCRTYHEDDTPSATDAFDVHHRIARTIERVIEETTAAKAIGLSGTWGAGKSSVVRMLEEIYADRPETRVVWTFDAWAHEGDPLRRTFLESLIAALADRKWLVASEWTNTLDVLSKRRKIMQRHSAPRLTTMGVLIAVSVLLIPLGTALFSNQIRTGIVFGWGLSPDWLAVTGLMLALGPLLALVVWSLWVLVARSHPGRTWQDELMNALTVFIQRTDTDSYTETLDSGDPTSLEFERDFRRVMEAALGQHPERRLVLVIDNLDRVGPPQALAIWSTLQTFVQRRGSGGWIDRLWCLLPFDADAIRRLWQKENAPGSAVAESFLDKTFQLRFDVPLPRLANWKDYLVAALGRAMPDHTTTDEFFKIYRLYSVRRSTQWQAPTPRQLKLFVNQVGSLHRHWQHEIPLEDLAYYVLLQNEAMPIVTSLLDGTLPAAAEAGLVSDQVQSSLAALVYGSSVEASHEVLLRQPILDALEAGDSTRLDGLAVVSDKFWLVLELALDQGCAEWPTAEGGLLLHAAAALAGTGLVHDESPWRVAALFHRLGSAVRATQVWTPMDARAIDGAIVMAHRDPSLGSIVYEGFTAARFVQPGTMTALQAREFAADYTRLSAALGHPRPAARLDTSGPDAFIALSAALADADPDGVTWAHFGTGDFAAVEQALFARQIAPGWASVVHVAIATGWTHWPELVQKATKGLTDDEGYTSAQQLELLAAIHALASVGESRDATKLLSELTKPAAFGVDPKGPAERALLLALAAVAAPDEGPPRVTDPDALGAWLYTLLVGHGTLAGVWHSRKGLEKSADRARLWVADAVMAVAPELTHALAKATLQFGSARTLFKVAREIGGFRNWPADRPLMCESLVALAEMGAPPRVFPPELVVDEWDASFPSWSRYTLVKAMRARRPEIADALLNAAANGRLASAYAGALDAHASGDDQLLAKCAAYLPTASAADWRDSLHGGEMGLPYLHAALARRGTTVALTPPVQDVVREFVTSPPPNIGMDATSAAATMGTFSQHDRGQVLDHIVVAFAALMEAHHELPLTSRATLSQAGALAAFAGEALFDAERIRSQRRLFPALAAYVIGGAAAASLPVLIERLRAEPALLDRLSPAEGLSLAEACRQKMVAEGTPESVRPLFATLAEMLVLPKRRADVQGT